MCTPDLLDQRLAIAEGRCQSYCQLPDPNSFPKVSENQECRYRRLDRSIQLYSFLHLPICAFEMVFTQRCRSETPLDHRAFAFPAVIVMGNQNWHAQEDIPSYSIFTARDFEFEGVSLWPSCPWTHQDDHGRIPVFVLAIGLQYLFES